MLVASVQEEARHESSRRWEAEQRRLRTRRWPLPALHPRSYALLDVFNLRYLDAAKGRGPARVLPIADQTRVRQWIQRFDEQLIPARSLLGLAASLDEIAMQALPEISGPYDTTH